MSRRREIRRHKEPIGRIWRQLFLLVGLLFIMPVGLYFLIKAYTPAVTQGYYQLMKREGLTVQTILVEGRHHTSKESLLKLITAFKGKVMSDVTVEALETSLKQLPWVRVVSIRKQWPDTLSVHLTEHIPIARWQVNQHLKLLTAEGVSFEPAEAHSFSHLPYVLGDGADKVTDAFLKTLKKFPIVYKEFVSAVWVGKRRWNIHLRNGLTVRLREDGALNDLAKLTQYLQDKAFMKQNPDVIDLRIPSKTIVKRKKKS